MTTASGWDDDGVAWRSGSWSLQRRGDELADLAHDGRRVLRSIRAAVRDRDWNTADWTVGTPVDHGGVLRIPLLSRGYGSDLRGTILVEVQGDTLSVAFDAVSHTSFQTNRTGLVVLHPPDAAGSALRVQHPDGSLSETAFPLAISAHQPVLDIAALAWVGDGSQITVDFSGDVFEMEDQRNWTDASFKTYSRPLALPFPYELAEGDRVHQRIDVHVRAVEADNARDETARINLSAGGTFPTIGVAASTAPDPVPVGLDPVGAELLVELDLDTRSWPAALRRAADGGQTLDVRAVLRHPDRAALDPFAAALRELDVARIAIFDAHLHVSDVAHVEALRAALAEVGVEAPVVGGSRSHFTELNRERARLPGDLSGIVTTVTPLFHSLSAAQLVESVAMQRLVAQQTVAYADGLPVHVGPVSLRPRFNNVATGPQPSPTRPDLAQGYGAEFTGAVDPRQHSEELAAWTVASAAALAVDGVAGLIYFEQWGPRGIRDAAGVPYPVAAAVTALAELAGATLLRGDSPDGSVWALGARTSAGDVILAANLDRVERSFEVAVSPAQSTARRIPIVLPPRGWAMIGDFLRGDGGI